MSVGADPPQTVVRACPKCGKKNRMPAAPPKHGDYTCGSCQATIVAAQGRRGVPRRLVAAYALWALLLLTVTVSNVVGPERWWPGSANLYLPQIVWALPAVLLIPWTLRRAPRWTPLSLLFLLWVFGPLMGLVWHPGGNGAGANGAKIRVMQCNIKWGQRDPQELAREVLRQNPDLIQFQDSGGDINNMQPLAQELTGWNIVSSGQYITASRLPISPPQNIDISFPGSDHHCTRIVLTVGGRQVALYNVHLLSPRIGLLSVRHHDAAGMTENADARLYEAAKLAAILRREPGPVLLTGDLNAPMQALVCREVMGTQFKDAFQESGSGYGYSYGQFATEHLFRRLGLPDKGLPFSRIDHILYTDQWVSTGCWTGSDAISDHVPVYADLYLK